MGRIGSLYIEPSAQGQGVGSALMATAEMALAAAGVGFITLDSSLAAMAFYERHGYQAVARQLHKTRGGLEIAMRQMEKTL